MLGEDHLEKEMATHSGILAWKMSWTGEPGGTTVHGGHKESDMTEHSTTYHTSQVYSVRTKLKLWDTQQMSLKPENFLQWGTHPQFGVQNSAVNIKKENRRVFLEHCCQVVYELLQIYLMPFWTLYRIELPSLFIL